MRLVKATARRLSAAILLSILPPALVLAVLAARGEVSFVWLIVAVAAALVGGSTMIAISAHALAQRADLLATAAQALEHRTTPIDLIHDEGEAVGIAERRLLRAGAAIVEEYRALAEQRDEFDAIVRSMAEGVVVTGERGEVILLNAAARLIFGLDRETDYRGRRLVELCRDPQVQEMVDRSLEQASDGLLSAEVALHNPEPRYLRVSAAAVGEANRKARRVLVFHDISQLRAYENMRADFVANLTHEVRTPLAALQGYAETLLRGTEDEATRERFLTIIERQSRRLSRLVDDLTSLSDLERGITPLRFEPIEPRRLIDEAVELMREQAERRAVQLTIDCSDALGELVGDHDRLQQVLLNLLDNAIKYTPSHGTVTVTGRMGRLDARNGATGPAVELIVEDTGEGIPPAHIPRLTERFYRVDRARSRELGGTGLGLAIVKHIVQQHHGQLTITSRVREGTKVSVRLPASVEERGTEVVQEGAGGAGRPAASQG